MRFELSGFDLFRLAGGGRATHREMTGSHYIISTYQEYGYYVGSRSVARRGSLARRILRGGREYRVRVRCDLYWCYGL